MTVAEYVKRLQESHVDQAATVLLSCGSGSVRPPRSIEHTQAVEVTKGHYVKVLSLDEPCDAPRKNVLILG